MSKVVTSILVAAALASCARAGSAANALIGRWHLVSWQPNTNPNWVGPVCTVTDMVFTSTTSTSYDPQINPAVPVSYNIQPDKVVVTGGEDVIYDIIDADHVRRDDTAKCTYQRSR